VGGWLACLLPLIVHAQVISSHVPLLNTTESHLADARMRLKEAEEESKKLRPECQRLQAAVDAMQSTWVTAYVILFCFVLSSAVANSLNNHYPPPSLAAIRCDRAISDTVQGQQQGSVTADMLAALRLERDQVQHRVVPISV